MANKYNTPVSIEKLAAYMDGNLTSEETRDVSIQIEHNPVLSEIMSVNQNVDKQLRLSPTDEFTLPEELNSLDFNIPSVSLVSETLNTEQCLDFSNTYQDYSTLNNENGSYPPDTLIGDDITIPDLNL